MKYMPELAVTRELGEAIALHLGLDPSYVSEDYTLHTGPDEVLAVTLKVYLKTEDLAGIAIQLQKVVDAVLAKEKL